MLTLIGRICKIPLSNRPREPRRAMSAETLTRVDWSEAAARLDGSHPREIVRWAVETFYPKLTMATAFGPEGC